MWCGVLSFEALLPPFLEPSLDTMINEEGGKNVEQRPSLSDSLEESLLPYAAEVEAPRATLLASIFNLANTTLGAGIVAIPYFFSQCGIILGSIILVVVSVLSAQANLLLIAAAEATSTWSYVGVAEKAFGARGLVCMQITILALTAGVMSAFFVELGQSGESLLDSGNWWAKATFIKIWAALFILLPLGSRRNLSALASASFIVLLCIIYVIIIVIFMRTSGSDDAADDGASSVEFFFFGEHFFAAVPIIVLAFGNQVNVHQVVQEMDDPSPARIRTLVFATNGVVSATYLSVGIAGYARFGGVTEDNILNNYGDLHGTSLGFFSIAQVGILIVVLFSYPMLLFPCRACLHSVVSKGGDLSYASSATFLTETAVIISVTLLISVVVPVLSQIMGYTGAVAGTLLGFIYPAACNLKSVSGEKPIPLTLLVVGVVFAVVCFAAQLAADVS